MARLHVVLLDEVAADDGVVVLDGRGRIQCADARAEALLGGSSASLAALRIEQLLADEAGAPIVVPGVEGDVPSRRIDGAEGPESVHVVDVPSLGAARRRAEDEVRRWVAEALTANYVARGDGSIVTANPSFVSLFGFQSMADAAGANLLDLFGSGREASLFLADLAKTATIRRRTIEMRQRDGTRLVTVQNAYATFAADGSIDTLRGYISDRTEEKELEQQLLRAQRMDAVGRLAGGIAHDFNNLLTIMLNYGGLLQRTLPEGGNESGLAGEIVHAAERAAELTRRLLAFGRKQVMQPLDVEMNELIERARPLIHGALREDIEIDCILTAHATTVHVDPALIEQVILNLVVNAKDAMPAGGRLTLETETVVLNGAYRRSHPWATPGRYVLVTVTDTGVGIPSEVVEHVFEPFFTTKEPGKGTGLGLASAYGIIKQHRGMIHVYSEPGMGTTFKLYLPVSHRPASSVGRKLAPVALGGRETLLVAEDDASVRAMLVRLLTENGYHVIRASDGEEALQLFRKYQSTIRLAILDVVMPRMGGVAAYRALRELAPELPIVMTSGYSAEVLSLTDSDDDRMQFVSKPYGPDEMLLRVRAVLDDLARLVS